ncbi:hypothetical protein [Streptacidiphilus jiangxiensis]|uniref:Sugar lactone lactonase YvrE n=1 Tax=Streptacidiphilus jiangxiensis TaxID=235985 RepID=A0A1H7V2G8_STRJI|nr:hypothetical protein [Streptacidiphilus jiangxiensis]SEM03336.1 Sugar lactone lactonase YvrE [Streptacidiphilus jiangxiensis]
MKKLLPVTGALVALTLSLGALAGPAAASATATPAHVLAHFDFTEHQTPENLAVEPGGAVDLTFSVARQVARVQPDGKVRVLATMPLPKDGGANTPVLGFAATMGLVRGGDGTVYFLYAAGSRKLTGVWRLRPHGRPERIAALPADSLPNGLALDGHSGTLYVADSALGRVWSVPVGGGRATVWSDASELAAVHYLGANGIKVHDDAVWVSNTDQGTVVRIPLLPDGRASRDPQVWASGLDAVDDFAFTGPGPQLLVALNKSDQVVRVDQGGVVTPVLGPADGLENPSSLAVDAGSVYVASAAYLTHVDPNLLTASLGALTGRD